MSFNYAPLKSSGTALIKKFGQELTFSRITQGAYSAATGTTTNTTTTFKKHACIFDYSDRDIGTNTVEAGDRRLLAEAHTYEIGDTVAIGTDTYRIISISLNQPAGTALSVDLQVRK
tara:strand:- start:475 stop:825 length:351 start_codon:yes stop_codon:yes gene_type:complete